MAQEGTGEGEIGEAMAEPGRESFEGIVALVDEDSLKVAAKGGVCVLNRQIPLTFVKLLCI
jgi:hypothetical protein